MPEKNKIKYLLRLLTSAAQAIIVTCAALNYIYAVNKVQNNVQVCVCVCEREREKEQENLVQLPVLCTCVYYTH